jgi:hypothetical protein
MLQVVAISAQLILVCVFHSSEVQDYTEQLIELTVNIVYHVVHVNTKVVEQNSLLIRVIWKLLSLIVMVNIQ